MPTSSSRRASTACTHGFEMRRWKAACAALAVGLRLTKLQIVSAAASTIRCLDTPRSFLYVAPGSDAGPAFRAGAQETRRRRPALPEPDGGNAAGAPHRGGGP